MPVKENAWFKASLRLRLEADASARQALTLVATHQPPECSIGDVAYVKSVAQCTSGTRL